MRISRVNLLGMPYVLTDTPEGDTHIDNLATKKDITVKFPIDTISASWFDWQHKRQLIQNAFPYLSPDEREFIMTGITPEEWENLFGEDESEKGH